MTSRTDLGDWTPEQLEANGRLALARIAAMQRDIRSVPVHPAATPAQVRAALDPMLPRQGQPFAEILDDTWATVVPHLTHWHHPSFHAYFSNSSSGPGIVADAVISALNVNSMLWTSSPAASAVEEIVIRWVCQMIGYPDDADGVLVNGASLGTFYALNAARDAVPGLDARTRGLVGRPEVAALRIYATPHAHSSVDKAVIALGIGLDNIVRVPCDQNFAMIPAALADLIAADRRAGLIPMAVVATDGTTATGAQDPLGAIAEVCRDEGVWLHVDAAYGGLWRLAPGIGEVSPALDVADSLVVNPHKTLFVPMECGLLLSRRRDALAGSFRLVPDYLATRDAAGTVDYMDLSLQLGRPFRALKLWWVIRSFGLDGLRARLAHAAELAELLRRRADTDPDWHRVGGSVLPLVCLRYLPTAWAERGAADRRPDVDALNLRILSRVNASGAAYLSKTTMDDGVVLRVSIGNIQTRRDDVLRLWDLLRCAARAEMAALAEVAAP
jgi:aromatic-L-amino-acid decarboxylase